MKKKMRLTLKQYWDLILGDVIDNRFCERCGKELKLYKGAEKYDRGGGQLKVAWFAVRCPNGIKAFKKAGVSAYYHPPKHYLCVAHGVIIIKD